ncbi:hypothetical protein IFM89_021785 [Coptis chinensis]|uniref:tRNA pseudouridine(55) synthase n=1 Tax=Coptis chinensis TaxID=261450 RepID=A0A835IP19_9MAGN|nr:hypothetical protein IFM89_021785 [Coptis chinensis]
MSDPSTVGIVNCLPSGPIRNSLKHNNDSSTETVDSVQGLECSEDASGEVGSAMDTSLNGLQVSESFNSAPEKVKEPCCLTCHCYRTPIYVGGRYLKVYCGNVYLVVMQDNAVTILLQYSRNVSQTQWIIDDERMGEASVEEIIGNTIIPICRGDKYKFHAAGREDIDVRMLGSGRPFLVEVQNARHDPSKVEMTDIEEKINNSEIKLVRVKNLKVVGNQGWTLMREGEAEKQKQYAALVWISRSLGDEDLNTLSSLKDMQIVQRTPVRVLHRRSPLDREKIIHWMKVEKIVGSTQYFLLHLCTQAGTYIKEFVHGDLGRTQPRSLRTMRLETKHNLNVFYRIVMVDKIEAAPAAAAPAPPAPAQAAAAPAPAVTAPAPPAQAAPAAAAV